MTRTGSIVYYLAAIVTGCLFMTAAIAASGVRTFGESAPTFKGLFLLYFLSLVYGWFTAVIFAIVLRLAAKIIRFRAGWHWAVAGFILTPAVIWALSAIWTRFLIGVHWPSPAVTAIVTTIFFGPMTAVFMTPSLAIGFLGAGFAGAATAWVLFSIHRAFDPNQPHAA